jgi:hypothetical protein
MNKHVFLYIKKVQSLHPNAHAIAQTAGDAKAFSLDLKKHSSASHWEWFLKPTFRVLTLLPIIIHRNT